LKAKQKHKRGIESGSEFFGELAFLVTFLAMKKVTYLVRKRFWILFPEKSIKNKKSAKNLYAFGLIALVQSK